MNIVIKNLKDIPCPLYYNQELIGEVTTVLDFIDVRVQIKKLYLGKEYQWTPYYFIHNEKVVRIDSNGLLDDWEDGFFDIWQKLMMELV